MMQKSLAYGIRFVLLVLTVSLVAFSSVLDAPANADTAATVRVNSGSGAFTESNGIAWAADSGYDGGRVSSTSSKIANTTNSRLYQTYRVEMRGYALPVTSGQRYRVRVFLTETYFQAARKRVFDISAEGALVADNVDIYAAAGYKRAYNRSFEVAVTDGTLNLGFTAVANIPVVSGIEAVPVGAIDSGLGTTPTGDTPSKPKLSWAPPHLDSPITVTVSASNHVLKLDPTRDYLVRMPSTKLSVLGGLVIVGGHDVVLIGGAITIPSWGASHPTDNRGLYLKEQTGTVHIEGLLIDNSGGALSEGININAPKATVQLQNIRVDRLQARDEVGFSDNHPDLVQSWAGPAELRVDRFSGTTDYQGIFLAPEAFGSSPSRRFDLRRVNITTTATARYLLWQEGNAPLRLDDVWIQPSPGRYELVWPSDRRWDPVSQGSPPAGDFARADGVGLGYRSPGYVPAA
jgi:hypothetical protein